MAIKTLKTRCKPSSKQIHKLNCFFKERVIIWNLLIETLGELFGETSIKKIVKNIPGSTKFQLMKLFRDPENKVLYRHYKQITSDTFECILNDFFQLIERMKKDKKDRWHLISKSFKDANTCRWHRKDARMFGCAPRTIKKYPQKDIVILIGVENPIRLAEDILCDRSQIQEVTIKREYGNEYYAYITYKYDLSESLPKTGRKVGIDLGKKNFLACFDGKEEYFLDYEKKDAKHHIKEIKKCQRRMDRKYELTKKRIISEYGEPDSERKILIGKERVLLKKLIHKNLSKNYFKARLALIHARKHFTFYKDDWIKKTCLGLAEEYDNATIESLNVEGMKRFSRGIARGIQTKPFYKFKAFLVQKFRELGKEVYCVPLFYPSTQKCSDCGYIRSKEAGDKLKRNDRVSICPKCGCVHDRDINAAINLFRESKDISPAKLEDERNERKREKRDKARKEALMNYHSSQGHKI